MNIFLFTFDHAVFAMESTVFQDLEYYVNNDQLQSAFWWI